MVFETNAAAPAEMHRSREASSSSALTTTTFAPAARHARIRDSIETLSPSCRSMSTRSTGNSGLRMRSIQVVALTTTAKSGALSENHVARLSTMSPWSSSSARRTGASASTSVAPDGVLASVGHMTQLHMDILACHGHFRAHGDGASHRGEAVEVAAGRRRRPVLGVDARCGGVAVRW